MSDIIHDGFTITVRDIADLLRCTETSVWRWMKKPFRLRYRRKITSDNSSGRVHHVRLADLIARLRVIRRGGLSEDETAAFVHLDSERRRHAANIGA